TGEGWVLSGLVVASYDERPIDVRYRATVDEGWATRSVVVTVDQLKQPRRLELDRSSDGNWTVVGLAAPELDGCVDVDLGVTPSTNTLPIRRLDLDVGAQEEIEVAWVRFPDLRVERGRQHYARIAAELWRYSSGDFTADLIVDEVGLVIRYGADLWQQVAMRR
ncbi:MAG: putative glycolipid-binding domain-containing protein, partial [Actinomycetota bacterium]|nr:putative glycolipid-binding domain-containing protein [Actinomycetota bacterium]